jgi:hypothetical protein
MRSWQDGAANNRGGMSNLADAMRPVRSRIETEQNAALLATKLEGERAVHRVYHCLPRFF